MNWRETLKLNVGDRVVFNDDFDIYPITIVGKGMKATVTDKNLDQGGYLWVLPDAIDLREMLAEWDGKVMIWSPDGGAVENIAEDSPLWLETSPLDMEAT